jgi:hypothetical protein
LSELDEFLCATGDANSKIERGNETKTLSIWDSFQDNHVGSDSYQRFGYAEVSKFDVGEVGSFCKESAFETCGPGAEPREGATREVFN